MLTCEMPYFLETQFHMAAVFVKRNLTQLCL